MKIDGCMRVVSLSLVLFLSACATTLAPRYDQAVHDGLTALNSKTMEFFASLSEGGEREGYAERSRGYNKLIGGFDALSLQARARPMPSSGVIDRVNQFLDKRGAGALVDSEAPSASAMERVSRTLVKMRDTDKKQGVTAMEVKAFKGQVVIYLDQALTYESFLKR